MTKKTIYILFLFISITLPGQEDKPKNWSLNGYVKNLQTWLFFNESFPDLTQFKLVDTFLQDNLIHNRLNFRWFPNDKLTLRADLRTRVFFGDLVKARPNYGDLVDDANNDFFDLSLVLLDKNSWVIHSMIDRLYLEYVIGNWEIRLGRQRVNWGINSVWNPNDIFNAFAFTDFDYEERPGSDALRVKYFTGFASSLELAVKIFDNFDEAVIAGMWKWNKWKYDFQLLAGYAERDLVFGVGWAGNIKNASFKGETTYFLALDEGMSNSFALSLGGEYSFSNSIFLSLGYLYNSRGTTDADVSNLFSFELSSKNLYPYKHAIFTQVSYPINPLLNGGLAIIYSPVNVHALFLNPNLTFSIAGNWDLDLIGQIVFNQQMRYTSPIQSIFLRFKFSF